MKEVFNSSLNKTYTKLCFLDKNEKPFLCIAKPIFKDKLFLGTTVFKISLNKLNKMLENREGLGITGEALLGIYNENKDIVLFTPLRFSKYPLVISHKNLKLAIPMRDALDEKNEKIVYNKVDYRNVNVTSLTDYFKPLNIGIVVKKDTKEIMEPANKLKKELFQIIVIVIIISILLGYIYSVFIVRPIKHIAKISSQIANGNFNHRVKIFPNDEVGEMAHSINKMADTIVNINTNLEKRVEEKTRQLSETNEKLNHIFDITPNITILTDGKTIIKVNRQFLEFTGYGTLSQFLKEYTTPTCQDNFL